MYDMDYHQLNQEVKESLYWSPHKKREKRIFLSINLILIGIICLLLLSIPSFKISVQIPSKIFAEKERAEKEENTTKQANVSSATTENNSSQKQKNENSKDSSKSDKTESSSKESEVQHTNILLIGIPGEPWPAPNLTDSIKVISLNKNSEKSSVSTISIPRDLLVKIPGSEMKTRINALYSIGGIKMLKKKIKQIVGLKIHHFALLDLSTLKRMISIVGGVKVEVKNDIYDPRFPTKNRGYQTFSISKGTQHLDAETAIKYMRSRHQARGDFGRIERQQQVMKALRGKLSKLNIFSEFPKLVQIYKEIRKEDKTNLDLSEIKTLYQIATQMREKKVDSLLLEAGKSKSLLKYGETVLGGNVSSVLWPKAGKFNYSKIRERAREITK